jgi:hypothetical protein
MSFVGALRIWSGTGESGNCLASDFASFMRSVISRDFSLFASAVAPWR